MHTYTGITLILGWLTMGICTAQVNSTVENFTLQNLSTDSTFNLEEDCEAKEAVVLIFISTYCPFAKSYKDRIIELSEEYSEKEVQFVLINPENPQDSPEAMAENAKAFKLPYLLDTAQVVTKKLEAIKTPEVFLLQKSLGHFVVKYHGAIDDNPQVAEEVDKFYLKEALEAILNENNPSNPYQKPTGCMIKN